MPYYGKGLDVWAFTTIFQPLAYTIACRPVAFVYANEHNSQHKDHTIWLGFDPGIVTDQKVSTVPPHHQRWWLLSAKLVKNLSAQVANY